MPAAALGLATILVLLLLASAALAAPRAEAFGAPRAGERIRWERDPWLSELRAKGRWPPRAVAPLRRDSSWWFGTAAPWTAAPWGPAPWGSSPYAGCAAPLELSLPLRGFYAYLHDYPPPARMPYNA